MVERCPCKAEVSGSNPLISTIVFILWLNENLPVEYLDSNDLVKGYDALAKADVFLGRTNRKQNYRLWSYACDIMNGGIATAKTHDYPNDKYSFPSWLREVKDSKSTRDLRDSIVKKISLAGHNSNSKTKDFIIRYFTNIFRNNTGFAIKMRQRFDFSESEIKYLLGEKHIHKTEEILNPSETLTLESTEEETTKPEVSDENFEKESKQQSLFDF